MDYNYASRLCPSPSERGVGECAEPDRMALRFEFASCLNLENRLDWQLVT
jgi:hypothetical protein